jgi:hypothetical protein
MASTAKGAIAKVLVLALVFIGYSTYSQKPLLHVLLGKFILVRFGFGPDLVRFRRKVLQIVKTPVPRGTKNLATLVHFDIMSDDTHE